MFPFLVTKFYFASQHCIYAKLLLTGSPRWLKKLFMMLKHAENQVVIRKYANRRLYDTSVSRYVTIDDLSMMVKDNIDFRVVDATNGQDITRVTLVQIILELSRTAKDCCPLEF